MPRPSGIITADDLIDAFVEKINASPREPAWPDDVPPSLRLGPPNKFGRYDWRIQKQDGIDWISPMEEKLPGPLPPSFQSLVTRYVYPEFEAGGLWFFANTREQAPNEWRTWLWKDKYLSRGLLTNGYIQFARPDTGSYDPVCFRRSGHSFDVVLSAGREAGTARGRTAVARIFPQELDALLHYNHFVVEAKFGDFEGTAFCGESRQQIFVCRVWR